MLGSIPLLFAARLDWGFGNANKTATLIVLLLVAVWALSFVHQHLFWLALALCAGLGVCLMLTASRGGFVAAFICFVVLLSNAQRPWSRSRIVGCVAIVWIVFGIALWLPIFQRFGKGISGEDLSISQRLELWHAAPQMMVDAPNGWGRGQASTIFHQWYQPLEHNQEFLSLVNSHLTWLVEVGWLKRFLYVFGWLTVLLTCWLNQAELRARWLVIPFAMWLGFALCAWFSSVAESPWLWIIPVISLMAVLIWRGYHNSWPSGRMWIMATLVACVVLGGCFVLGVSFGGPTRLRYAHERMVVGSPPDPLVWIVTNDTVLGKSYGRTFRKYIGSEGANAELNRVVPVGFVTIASALLPTDVQGKTLVVAGALDGPQLSQVNVLAQNCSKLILLNPGFYPQQLDANSQVSNKVIVIAGEFSQTPSAAWTEALHKTTQTVEGAGVFLPQWPELVLATNLADP